MSSLEVRLIGSFAMRRPLPEQARRALLHATELLTCASLLAMNRLAGHFDPRGLLLARLRRTQLQLAESREEALVLRSRLDRIAPRHRPHYTPQVRFQILVHKARYQLSASEAGRRFGVTAQTIQNWEAEARGHPGRETVGSLLKPVPPLRRSRDVVRRLVHDMKRHGFGGDRTIAQTLSAAAWEISARSVGRFRKQPPPRSPKPIGRVHKMRRVHASHPNHCWALDLTHIPTLFRFFSFKLCVVLDLYSRFPIAAGLFPKEPDAVEIADLVTTAVARHGKPRFLLSDQGEQFIAGTLASRLASLGIQPRHGAIGSHGSIAVVERFWKTLKSSSSLRSPLPSEVQRRLDRTLLHYAYHRPHQTLGGRTPAEVYFHLPHSTPVPAPRGRPGEAGPDPPVVIAFLDPDDQTLPILIPRAA